MELRAKSRLTVILSRSGRGYELLPETMAGLRYLGFIGLMLEKVVGASLKKVDNRL
jgi:hypothetical protein